VKRFRPQPHPMGGSNGEIEMENVLEQQAVVFRKFVCRVCDHVYDEAAGDAASGLAPGTRWEDVPEDWVCPDCGSTKADFVAAQ
jgi:rubredoxin